MVHLRFVQYRAEELAFRRNNDIGPDRHNFQISPQIKVEFFDYKNGAFTPIAN